MHPCSVFLCCWISVKHSFEELLVSSFTCSNDIVTEQPTEKTESELCFFPHVLFSAFEKFFVVPVFSPLLWKSPPASLPLTAKISHSLSIPGSSAGSPRLSMFWHGANSHRPMDLPDTTGLRWREGIRRCLKNVLPQAIISPPSSAALLPSPSAGKASPQPSAANTESTPEPAPVQELMESTPELAPFQEFTECPLVSALPERPQDCVQPERPQQLTPPTYQLDKAPNFPNTFFGGGSRDPAEWPRRGLGPRAQRRTRHGFPSHLIRHGYPNPLIRHGPRSPLFRHGCPSPLIHHGPLSGCRPGGLLSALDGVWHEDVPSGGGRNVRLQTKWNS